MACLPYLSFRGLHPLPQALKRRGKLLDRQAQLQGAAVKTGKSVYRTTLVALPDSLDKVERQGQLAEKIQYFTEHLMDRRRWSSVEPGFQGTCQPSRRAGARSATGQGKRLESLSNSAVINELRPLRVEGRLIRVESSSISYGRKRRWRLDASPNSDSFKEQHVGEHIARNFKASAGLEVIMRFQKLGIPEPALPNASANR